MRNEVASPAMVVSERKGEITRRDRFRSHCATRGYGYRSKCIRGKRTSRLGVSSALFKSLSLRRRQCQRLPPHCRQSSPHTPAPYGRRRAGSTAGARCHPHQRHEPTAREWGRRRGGQASISDQVVGALRSDRPHHAEPFLDKILTATREFFHLSPKEKVMYSNMVDADVAAVRGSFLRSTASTTSTPTGRSSTGATGYTSRSSQRRNVGWISSQNTC
ncbi:Os06g0591450 [Oryza sativa Japonica Group]|uniref:Os06g0591450 protein n=2 Tax=Oryza sativa subsp. japonica TaxID=39947 RepID=A0A0P0WY88_ORYSJ|nr:hypothetical protein EE612_035075 [Oryza sativa]BAS98428.1 Os06g0591450 [Oryza sativa Japonica Group]